MSGFGHDFRRADGRPMRWDFGAMAHAGIDRLGLPRSIEGLVAVVWRARDIEQHGRNQLRLRHWRNRRAALGLD